MKQLWKWIAKVMFYTVSVGLFVYAASRSLDFITATLPPDQQILGYLGLLATGGGAIAWLFVFMHYAQGTGQKGLAILFVVIDLIGEFTMFTFDTCDTSYPPRHFDSNIKGANWRNICIRKQRKN